MGFDRESLPNYVIAFSPLLVIVLVFFFDDRLDMEMVAESLHRRAGNSVL
jgi:hypothetical protein